MNDQESLDNCVFCRIPHGDTPASIVAETTEALAFMDINQPAPGHVLVIPRVHLKDIYEVDDQTASLFQLTVHVAKAVKLALFRDPGPRSGLRDPGHPDGLNLLQASERAGQQNAFHFYIHIVARYLGDRDRIRLGWQSILPDRAELERLAAQIRSAL